MQSLFKTFCLLLLPVLCQEGQQEDFYSLLKNLYSGTVPTISADSLNMLMGERKIFLLDIRSKKEYRVSHVQKSILVEYESFHPSQVQKISKNDIIILYCAVGYRSEKTGEKLLRLGFKNVAHLYGGIFAWKNASFPLYSSNEKITDSIHTYNKEWSRWVNKGIKVYEE
ncbi:MAG: rhodanese-like domain-containing protein [Chitinophagaceae bacterium]|nr:rhodanese-like domain-containing protein [Chitinophagaceae bacterium]